MINQDELGLGLPPSPAKRSRPKDLVFEAMVFGCGLDPHQITRSARGALNGALRDIREVRPGLTPIELLNAIASYRKQHPTWTLSPAAIAKHWPSLIFIDTQKFPPNVREQLAAKLA